jgi:hypothetical protein
MPTKPIKTRLSTEDDLVGTWLTRIVVNGSYGRLCRRQSRGRVAKNRRREGTRRKRRH